LTHPGLHGLAHITGGGLTDNLPRIMPRGLGARIHLGSWRVPELYQVLEREGRVAEPEMFRVFNMGIGMVLVVAETTAEEILASLPNLVGCPPSILGQIELGSSETVYLGP
jgi:phosphoribosylformylglycinamidine cyclo-ligase